MPTITLQMIQYAYEFGKKYYNKQIRKSDAVESLVSMGMNESSAMISLELYSHLKKGEVFKRATTIDETKYYLDRIYNEEGLENLQVALSSMELHLDYWENQYNASARSRRNICNEYSKLISLAKNSEITYPEEIIESRILVEGGLRTIQVNAYERNSKARIECLKHYGYKCIVCDFNFEEKYGNIGKNYIHVHHKIDIAHIGVSYEVDPINDLIPVCPNCHAMLHTKKPALKFEELKEIIRPLTNGEPDGAVIS